MDQLNNRLDKIDQQHQRLDEKYDRLEGKQDAIIDRLNDLVIHTSENTASLREHMNQTAMVRQEVEILKTEMIADRVVLTRVAKWTDRIITGGTVVFSISSGIFVLLRTGLLKPLVDFLYRIFHS